MGQGSWKSRVRQRLARAVDAGRTTLTLGELVIQFGNEIPLHQASRKWASGRGATPALASPDRMRFYTLSQYLHWLGCGFSPSGNREPKTWQTVVRIYARRCPVCGATMVHEKQIKTCSVVCGQQLRRKAQ